MFFPAVGREHAEPRAGGLRDAAEPRAGPRLRGERLSRRRRRPAPLEPARVQQRRSHRIRRALLDPRARPCLLAPARPLFLFLLSVASRRLCCCACDFAVPCCAVACSPMRSFDRLASPRLTALCKGLASDLRNAVSYTHLRAHETEADL
eukprot:150174-Rhodomonas_salina.2